MIPCRPGAGSVRRFDSARYCSYPRFMSAHRELRRIKLAAARGFDHAVASPSG